MTETWVPQPGERVRLNADARARRFHDGTGDGRKRWTVRTVLHHAGWAQPDVVMTNDEVWNSCWLIPAE